MHAVQAASLVQQSQPVRLPCLTAVNTLPPTGHAGSLKRSYKDYAARCHNISLWDMGCPGHMLTAWLYSPGTAPYFT